MFNKDKLRGKMAENRYTIERLSKDLGINPTTLSRKMAGESEFTRAEIQGISTRLSLSMQDIQDIFFAE